MRKAIIIQKTTIQKNTNNIPETKTHRKTGIFGDRMEIKYKRVLYIYDPNGTRQILLKLDKFRFLF